MPLYGQIAQALRWRIGTGALGPGDRLPGVREAAVMWGVSLHTVRRAYGTLVEIGLLESRPGVGTTVLRTDGENTRKYGCSDPNLAGWLVGMFDEGRDRFGLSPGALIDHLTTMRRSDLADAPVACPRGVRVASISVVECNEHQCRQLAGQASRHWRVPVASWSLDRPGDPPGGLLVGTRFHAPEMRKRWPGRADDMRFVSLVIDPGLRIELRKRLRTTGATQLELWERDLATGRQMADDVRRAVPGLPIVQVRVPGPPGSREAVAPGALVLVAPRLWDDLTPEVRENSRTIEVRYVVPEPELDGLWDELEDRPSSRSLR